MRYSKADLWLLSIRRGLIAICALLALLPLEDTAGDQVQLAYAHTLDLFLRGYLAKSQKDSKDWYERLHDVDPGGAEKFRLLEARSLSMRGFYAEAQQLVTSEPKIVMSRADRISKLTIEGANLTGLGDFNRAEQSLLAAENLCKHVNYPECEGVSLSYGVLFVEKEDLSKAKEFFVRGLAVARSNADEWLETTALTDLGWAFLQEEHYDEALPPLQSAVDVAMKHGFQDRALRSIGNLGWAYFGLGDSERALGLFIEARDRAKLLGDRRAELNWTKTTAYVYRSDDRLDQALLTFSQALNLATQTDSKKDILDTLEDLAHLSIETGDLDAASRYIDRVAPMARASGSGLDVAYVNLAKGKLAAARHEDSEAESLFRGVESDKASQVSMRFAAEHELALLYQAENRPAQAEKMYRTALATFEGARQQLKDDDSKLPFVANAKGIYDDYVRFLVDQNKRDLALMTADQSRARTLAQGLGMMAGGKSFRPAAVSAQAVARKADATLLFYWLGQRQSYLWAVTPRETALFPLPAEKEIAPLVERYDKDLLGAEDPVRAGNAAGQQLYRMLVQPAQKLIGPAGRVMLLTDGPLSRLNFEALIVPEDTKAPADAKAPGDKERKAHYWIEDATVSSAPSISMLAGGLAEHSASSESGAKLLLLGNPQSPSVDYPALPYAGQEMAEIGKQFGRGGEVVYAGPRATPQAYLGSKPERFPYIHFVSHGVASRMDPLDSAIILSRPEAGDEDSFKLYAREIMQHPIQARLVTISACYGSGTRAYAGEGLVGLSWAFLRAGAQRAIGALWEASDRSTPELMSTLYEGLEAGQTPATALRNAKLKLLHSSGNFRKPFYWAAFQLYTRV